jgi:DNA-binding LytR/AlgR family response regulator
LASVDDNGEPRITLWRMTPAGTSLKVRREPRWTVSQVGPRELVFAVWVLLALFALVQWVADHSRTQSAVGRMELAENIALIVLWGCATPAIVWSTRRIARAGSVSTRDVVTQIAYATALILLTNFVVRLPQLAPPFSVGMRGVAKGTLLAFAHYAPAAMAVYFLIAALGYQAWMSSRDDEVASSVAGTLRPQPDRVIVREWNRVHLLPPAEIHWVEADDNNVVVRTAARTYKGRGRIGDLETQLDAAAFVRIHRSAIVSVASIREVQPLTKGDLAVILCDGKVLRVARGRRAALEAVLRVPI